MIASFQTSWEKLLVMRDRKQFIGTVLMVVSALVFSTAGLFTKGVTAGAWDVIFWRSIFGVLIMGAYIILRGRWAAEFTNMGKPGWAVTLVGASGMVAFIPAFKLTSIANVSLIYAVTPLIAAFIAWVWLGVKATKPVIIGAGVAFIGVLVIVSGSLGGIELSGDLLALWMAIALALLMVIYQRHPETPAAGPAVLSLLISLPFALAFGAPFLVSSSEIMILAGFGLVFAIGAVTLGEGAKRLPAPETALLSVLEAPFAPIFAWLVLRELPSVLTVVGGFVILGGVVGSQLYANRKSIE